MKRRFALITAMLILCTSMTPFKDTVNLHGGSFPTRSMPIWELQKFKETELLRQNPLYWTPWESYLYVCKYVSVDAHDNLHWLTISEDLVELVKEDAAYNREHAKVYSGNREQKLRKIFNYCRKTKYVAHVKRARDVFESRQGDCAAITAAFYVLCKKNKIAVRYVIGWAYGECHAWARVKWKGKWWWVDPTLNQWLSRKQLPGNRSILEMW